MNLDPAPGLLRWRQRRWWSWLSMKMYAAGVTSSGCHSSDPAGWIVSNSYRGKRVYVLFIKRESWGHPWHWFRTGHWPRPVQLGVCGICAPMPCCGSTGWECKEGCDGEF